MKKLIVGLILFMLDGLGMFLFKSFPDFFFPSYRNISKTWIGFLSRITGIFPFSIWDIAAALLSITAIITLVISIRNRKFLKWFSDVFLLVSIMVFVAIYGWMLNHYAPDLSTYIDLDVKQYSVEELNEACEYYLLEAGKLSAKMDRDEEYHLKEYDVYEIGELAGKAYKNIENEYKCSRTGVDEAA